MAKWTMTVYPGQPISLYNRRRKLVKVLSSQEECDRFFDNRDPNDWERIDGSHVFKSQEA